MQRNILWNFYGPEDTQWAVEAPGGCPEGGTTHQGAPGPQPRQVGCAHLSGLPHRLFAL